MLVKDKYHMGSYVFVKLGDARLSSKLLDETDQFNRVPIVLE